MDTAKIQKLIADKNADREYHVMKDAGGIIEAIAEHQQFIITHQEAIVELRGELKALEVETLDSTAILGE